MTKTPLLRRLRRNPLRQVHIGSVAIGGESSISIQSMTNTPTEDVAATQAQITRLSEAGCDIVRLAVPTMKAARVLPILVEESPVPLVADIHFNYNLALAAIDAGVAGLRINPGNIGKEAHVRLLADRARAAAIPIRVGVNGGSLETDILARYGPTATGLVTSALRHVSILEAVGFHDIIISLKSSSVRTTLEANRRMATERQYPLHVGVTEAGMGPAGRIKSFLGIGILLLEGIGETIRISLTGDPVHEVRAARELLAAAEALVSTRSGGRP